jgi:hypothetical protein
MNHRAAEQRTTPPEHGEKPRKNPAAGFLPRLFRTQTPLFSQSNRANAPLDSKFRWCTALAGDAASGASLKK